MVQRSVQWEGSGSGQERMYSPTAVSGWDRGLQELPHGRSLSPVAPEPIPGCETATCGERSVLTVSTRLEGEFGLQDVCLSVPCIVSWRGVERIIASKLPEGEVAALSAYATVLKNAIIQLRTDA